MNKNLKFLTLNVIESCDASCIYCNWRHTNSSLEPLDALLKTVDQSASMGVKAIRISGGEPLLRSDLPALIAHIHQLGLISMVCTAAKCEINTICTLLDAGLDILSVSLDTLQPKLFRSIRGYEIKPILEKIEHLVKLRSNGNFEIVLSVVLTRLSIEGLGDILKYAKSLDLVVNITPCQTDIDALVFGIEDELILRDTMRIVKEAAVSGVRVINSDRYLDGIVDFQINRHLPAGYSCNAGDSAAIRLAGGKLKLCHSLKEIQCKDLATAWSSKGAETLRKRMARLDCPGCWLSCHADTRRQVAHRYGRPEIWEAL